MNNEKQKQYQYYPVEKIDDFKSGDRLFIEINEYPIIIFNIAGNIFAIADMCSHDKGPLEDGEIEKFEIVCPRHGARFDIRSGKVTSLPAITDIPSYPVKIFEGVINIGIPIYE